MADYTISSGDSIKLYKSYSAAGALTADPESTGQTFVVGMLLEKDVDVSTSSHRIAKATVSASTVTSTSICGIAAEGASSVVDTKRIYYRVDPQNEFIGRTRGGTLAQTQVGSHFGLCFDSTKNVNLVDLANTQSTSLRVVVTGLVDEVGDSGGRVTFKFGLPAGSTNTFAGGANPVRN